jgi:hypothetical protein
MSVLSTEPARRDTSDESGQHTSSNDINETPLTVVVNLLATVKNKQLYINGRAFLIQCYYSLSDSILLNGPFRRIVRRASRRARRDRWHNFDFSRLAVTGL